MKLPPVLKNFFSYFTFLIADRQLRYYKQLFTYKEKTYQDQLISKEHLIDNLREKILNLEFECKENKEEIGKRFKQMDHLQHQLKTTKKEYSDARQKLSALYMTNNKLIHFLEHNATKHAPVPHYH